MLISQIVPYERNARHNEGAVSVVASCGIIINAGMVQEENALMEETPVANPGARDEPPFGRLFL